ncbi:MULTISPECIES: PIG-L deacetylase family protein [unclassified Streptomyces]|uniref:PIG-L deacetylase family protein n=1 Tax=unclassified Streptomyces TaxID=2593676 RepID=UPI002E2AD739|nr:PIG-L family deacetylase [Streptomyces sp. NBC_00223]
MTSTQNRPVLPVPDAAGVYTFPDDLARAHQHHQDQLALRRSTGDRAVVQVTAPYGRGRYLIEQRRPSGRPLVVLEPHHDDMALSAGGLLLSRPRPLTVITVFTRSTSADRSVQQAHPGEDAISRLRAEESHQTLKALGAARTLLGHRDARPPYRPYDPAVLDQVTEDLEHALAGMGEAELLAPAAVTRHPDHLLVHEAARRLGCRWFWDDVAFWQTYGLSADDRHLFHARVGDSLAAELADITTVLLDKLTLLYLHASQLQPLRAMYRPLRYAWTTAAELRGDGDPVRFAERFYRWETR